MRKTQLSKLEKDIRDAENRFLSFSGHELDRQYEIKMPRDNVVFVFGEVWSIGYTAIRDGVEEQYLHEFRRRSQPMIAAGPGGNQLYLIGGNYKFGPRGIVDR